MLKGAEANLYTFQYTVGQIGPLASGQWFFQFPSFTKLFLQLEMFFGVTSIEQNP